ncbi:hypothetical protein DSO57_1017808 [Entomophthora muscae]|nr:hypothetical protein DSO57_1017808 [Entomophthora muscae]
MRSSDKEAGLLMVARRRYILHFLLGRQLVLRKEFPWPEPIVSICTNSTTVCIADASVYSLMDIRNGQTTRLFCPPFSRVRTSVTVKPSIVSVDDEEFLVTSPAGEYGAMGMFVSSLGDAVRGTITWKSYPRRVVFEFPFALALTTGFIEVHNIMTQALVQVVAVGNSVQSLVDNAGLWRRLPQLDAQLNTSEDQDISTIPCSVLIYGRSWVGCLSLESILLQIDHLLEANQAEAAVLATEDASAMVSEQSAHYRRMSRELRHAYQKCGLFYLSQTLLEDALLLLQRGRLDPRVLIGFFPEFRSSPSFAEYMETLNVSIDPGILNFAIEMDSVQSIVKKSIYQPQEPSPAQDSAAIALTSNITDMLRKYLVEYKARSAGRSALLDQLVAVDTTLLILLARDDPPALTSLLASENFCDLESCLGYFRSQKNLYAESLIYKAQGNAKEVFEIWMRVYDAGDSAVTLDAVAEYLVKQEDFDLVSKVAQWLVEKDPDTAAITLAKLPDPVFDGLGHSKMLQLLQSNGTPKSAKGSALFLEKLVFERGSQDPSIHLQLARAYLGSFENGSRPTSHQTQLEQIDHSFLVARTIRPQCTYMDFLNARNDRISSLRKKLVAFLLRSTCLPPSDMLSLLEEGPPLLLERAIVCSKLRLHRRALELLVQIQDFSGAELYCNNGGSFASPLPKDPELFKALLSLYLEGEDEQTMMEQAQSLLGLHYHHFHALEVLELLPVHWSADLFAPFFIAHLKTITCQKLEQQILKSLFISENIQVNSYLASTRSTATPVLIESTTLCDGCSLPLGSVEVVAASKPRGLYHSTCWYKVNQP